MRKTYYINTYLYTIISSVFYLYNHCESSNPLVKGILQEIQNLAVSQTGRPDSQKERAVAWETSTCVRILSYYVLPCSSSPPF